MSKKLLLISLLTPLLFAVVGCNNSSGFKRTNSANYDIIPLTGENEAIDYSKDSNWFIKQVEATNQVDLVYFYPSLNVEANEIIMCRPTLETQLSANYAFAETASCFAPYTNVFAPLYRQIATVADIPSAIEYFAKYNVDISVALSSYTNILTYTHVRTDAYAALDYYFEHYNNGRPFILAGHSQGSAMCQIILKEYFNVHPDLYKRMVAAYVGGFSITTDLLDAYPHLKSAQGENDTGVIVSWNTEAPGATQRGFANEKNSISINPLNWKTDDTYAGAELNKGMLSPLHSFHSWEIVHENLADAVVDLSRGSIVTSMDPEKYPFEKAINIAGEKSFHTYDYMFYYMNLMENGAKRIANFLNVSYESIIDI